MVFDWSTQEKLACLCYIENKKAFTLTNGDKSSFFLLPSAVLANGYKFRKNIEDLFVGRVKRDVAPPLFLGEELYNVVLKFDDIVFDFQSSKQKFLDFGLTHN